MKLNTLSLTFDIKTTVSLITAMSLLTYTLYSVFFRERNKKEEEEKEENCLCIIIHNRKYRKNCKNRKNDYCIGVEKCSTN